MALDSNGLYTSSFAQSGDSPDAGTSAQDTGTTSSDNGGSDYIDNFFKLADVAAAAYLGRPGPAVQPTLTAQKPVVKPGSATAGGAQPGVVGFIVTYQTEILLGSLLLLAGAMLAHHYRG